MVRVVYPGSRGQKGTGFGSATLNKAKGFRLFFFGLKANFEPPCSSFDLVNLAFVLCKKSLFFQNFSSVVGSSLLGKLQARTINYAIFLIFSFISL
jgi:hypothetical protein